MAWPTPSPCRTARTAWRYRGGLRRPGPGRRPGVRGAGRGAITRRQACYRPVTDDGLPLIGPVPGGAGAYVATGHGPWGMLNAPGTGLALADLIAGGASTAVDLRPFDPARLRPARA